MIKDHPFEDTVKLILLSIEEDMKRKYELFYYITIVIRTLNKEEIIDFDEYLKLIKEQSSIKKNNRSAEEIQNDFAEIIEKERVKNGNNI